ncbi:MAG: OmpH family outer membrane protein [Phycisphaerales bacterium]|nr:OmpH family outer membrane protein [Phycisphaerales bacterium]
MKRNGMLTALLVALVATTALAQWRAEARRVAMQSRPSVVAVVDIQRVINGLDELKDRERDLENLGAQLKARVESIDKKVADAKSAVELLPAESPERRAKQDELRRLLLDLRIEAEWAQQRIDEKRGEIYARLFRKIHDACGRLAKQAGYDMVISSDSAAEIPQGGSEQNIRGMIVSRRIFYTSESVDATNDLVQMLNNDHKMGAR